jgi:ribonuclease HI
MAADLPSRTRPTRPLKIFFDGGCSPNPGVMEIAVVAQAETHILRDLGQGGNDDAEWLALIHAVKLARSLGLVDYVLLGDAATVIAQASGRAKPRGVGIAHRAALQTLLAGNAPPRVRHIKRAQNLAGIALARLHDR